MTSLLNFSEKIGNFRFWRIMTNFWTGIFFVAIGYDYFMENSLAESNIILTLGVIYCASLAIYSAEKEFRRWHKMHNSLHPGEAYVIIWTILVVALITAQSFLHLQYHIPPEVSASYIAAITILAVTRESKNLYKKQKKSK